MVENKYQTMKYFQQKICYYISVLVGTIKLIKYKIKRAVKTALSVLSSGTKKDAMLFFTVGLEPTHLMERNN